MTELYVPKKRCFAEARNKIYLNHRFSQNFIYGEFYAQEIPVIITEVHWSLSKNGVVVWYDCESVKRSPISDRFSYFSVINNKHESFEKYFSEDGEHNPHPINFEHDFKYNIDDEVFSIKNNSVYGIFPPDPAHITRFSYFRVRKYLNGDYTGFNEKFLCSFYNPTTDSQWWDSQQSWDVSFECIIDKLPDDYLEKCWKGLRKSDVFRYEIYGYNSDHEKLFDYLGITDQAKQAYNDYKAGKFRNKSDKKTSEKKIISEKNLTNGIFSIVIDN